MKLIYTTYFFLFSCSLLLHSQKLITTVESDCYYDNLQYFTHNGSKYFNTAHGDSIKVYSITNEGEFKHFNSYRTARLAQGLRSAQYIVSKSHNNNWYHNTINEKSRNVKDLIGSGLAVWTGIYGKYGIIVKTDSTSYIIDLDKHKTAKKYSGDFTPTRIIKNHIVAKNNLQEYCIEHINQGHITCINDVKQQYFSNKNYFIYLSDHLGYLNLDTHQKYKYLEGFSEIKVHDISNHNILASAKNNNEHNLYHISLRNGEITKVINHNSHTKYFLTIDSTYLISHNNISTIRNLTDNSIIKEIDRETSKVIDQCIIISNNQKTTIHSLISGTELTTNLLEVQESISIKKDSKILKALKDSECYMYIQADESCIKQIELSEIEPIPSGLEYLTDIQSHNGNLYIEDKDVIQIGDTATILNKGIFYPNPKNWAKLRYYSEPPNYNNHWSDIFMDTLYIYETNIDTTNTIAEIPLNKIPHQLPFKKIHAIHKQNITFVLLVDELGQRIIMVKEGIISEIPIMNTGEDNLLLGFCNDQLYYGAQKVYSTNIEDFNTTQLDIPRLFYFPYTQTFDLSGECLLGNSSGLFRLNGQDWQSIIDNNVFDVNHFSISDKSVFYSSTNKVIEYNSTTKETKTVVDGFQTVYTHYPILFLKPIDQSKITHTYNVTNQTLTQLKSPFFEVKNTYQYEDQLFIIQRENEEGNELSVYKTTLEFNNQEKLFCTATYDLSNAGLGFNGSMGILIIGHKIYAFNKDYNFIRLDHMTAARETFNIKTKNGKIYFIAIDEKLGKQVYQISNLPSSLFEPNNTKDLSFTNTYPNPTCGYTRFKEDFCNHKYAIYSLNGQLLNSGIITNNEVNLSSYPIGTYIIQIQNKDQIWIGKILVSR